jgi:uncharacterized protein (DUF58 family)
MNTQTAQATGWLAPLRRLLGFSRLYTFLEWIFSRHRPEPGTIVLTQRRVYVLPTRQGLIFCLALMVMLIGSINYNLSLGYVLTFLLAGVGIVSILHTFRNLFRTRVRAGRVEPVFAGDTAQFRITLESGAEHDRHSLLLFGRSGSVDSAQSCDLPAGRSTEVTLPLPATQRGWLQLERITIETRFPLGLTRAWSYVQPDMRALVYPRPDDSLLPPPQSRPDMGDTQSVGSGTDDYCGMRPYQPSDSPRHVAWKATARGQEPLTKLFSGRAASELWFDYEQLPVRLDREARLSRLARWVLLAERGGVKFGMRLPGLEVPLGEGEIQRERCLKELALFQAADPGGAPP